MTVVEKNRKRRQASVKRKVYMRGKVPKMVAKVEDRLDFKTASEKLQIKSGDSSLVGDSSHKITRRRSRRRGSLKTKMSVMDLTQALNRIGLTDDRIFKLRSKGKYSVEVQHSESSDTGSVSSEEGIEGGWGSPQVSIKNNSSSLKKKEESSHSSQKSGVRVTLPDKVRPPESFKTGVPFTGSMCSWTKTLTRVKEKKTVFNTSETVGFMTLPKETTFVKISENRVLTHSDESEGKPKASVSEKRFDGILMRTEVKKATLLDSDSAGISTNNRDITTHDEKEVTVTDSGRLLSSVAAEEVKIVAPIVKEESLCYSSAPKPSAYRLRAADKGSYDNMFLYVDVATGGELKLKMGRINPIKDGVGLFRVKEKVRESRMDSVFVFTNLKYKKTIAIRRDSVTLMSPPTSPVKDAGPRVFEMETARSGSYLLKSTIGNCPCISYDETGKVTAAKQGKPFFAMGTTPV